MADSPVGMGQYLVSPDLEVDLLWADTAIEEKLRQIEGLDVAIRELLKVKIPRMEVRKMMLQKEVKHLKDKKAALGPIDAQVN